MNRIIIMYCYYNAWLLCIIHFLDSLHLSSIDTFIVLKILFIALGLEHSSSVLLFCSVYFLRINMEVLINTEVGWSQISEIQTTTREITILICYK